MTDTLKDIIKAHEEDCMIDNQDCTDHKVHEILNREDALIELVREMKPYLWHKSGCKALQAIGSGECTCKLDELKKRLEE